MKSLTKTVTGAAALLVLASCSSEDTEAAEPRPTATVITHTSPPSSPTPTESSTPDSISPGEDIEISCRNAESADSGKFTSIEEAWDLEPEDRARCSGWYDVANFSRYEMTDQELEAIEVAEYDNAESLRILYGQCASSYLGDHNESVPYSEGQVAEAQGALVLCPDHPEREEVESRIAAVEERHAGLEEIDAGIEDGSLIEVGLHKVGDGIEPGVYVTESEEGFDGCYWERLDSAGNIIANNFVRSGFRVEVEVQASDYSFSSNRCGRWERQ